MKLYLVVDLETGGLDASDCGITEIGAVCAERSEDWDRVHIVERFSTLIRPVEGLHYHAGALDLQHRNLADLAKGMSERTALCTFYGWIRSFRQWLSPWAHNADFDKGFLMAAHERLNEGVKDDSAEYVMCPYAIDFRCSMDLFKRLRAKGVHNCFRASLDEVLSYYGISIGDEARHTATGDVEATAHAVAAMMRDWRRCKNEAPALARV